MESSDSFIFFLILAMVVGFLAYIVALVNAAKNAKWLWFVLMLLMWPIFIFYFLMAYETSSRRSDSERKGGG